MLLVLLVLLMLCLQLLLSCACCCCRCACRWYCSCADHAPDNALFHCTAVHVSQIKFLELQQDHSRKGTRVTVSRAFSFFYDTQDSTPPRVKLPRRFYPKSKGGTRNRQWWLWQNISSTLSRRHIARRLHPLPVIERVPDLKFARGCCVFTP